jgi:thymidylate kinase
MSDIVEFIGPRGVGKSTVYKELVKQTNKKSVFAPAHDFLPIKSNINFLSLDYIRLLGKKVLKKPFVDNDKIRSASYEFISQNRKFSSLCWDLISKNQICDYNGTDNRLRVANNLYQYFGIYQTIVNSENPNLCIRDELLLHTMVQVTNNEETNEDDIIAFSNDVPLPKAVILFDAPAELLAERSFNRKINQSQKNKSFKSLVKSGEMERKKYTILKEQLINKKIPVFVIDTTQLVKDNVDSIICFISKI